MRSTARNSVSSSIDRQGRRRFLTTAGASGLVLLTAAGCKSNVNPPVYPDLTYGHLTPIALDIARVDIVQQYAPPATKPNVDHLFPVIPARAAAAWGRDRLRATGATGVARYVIANASVVEVPLKRTEGVRGVFTTDQSERYDGVVEILIDIEDPDNRRSGNVRVRAERSRSVKEGTTLLDRERIWFELVEALMADLNAALEDQLRNKLKNFVR